MTILHSVVIEGRPTLSCVDFMDVIMGDLPYLTTLCLNGWIYLVDGLPVYVAVKPHLQCVCRGGAPCRQTSSPYY